MTHIVSREGEPLSELIKRFERVVRREGVIVEANRRRFYEPPSITERRRKRIKLLKSRETTRKNLQQQGISM